jgi:hypothetical protein
MDGTGSVEGLGGALLGIALDPGRVGELHQLLERYVHRFRNRLNCMKMSLYLARRLETGDRIADWVELEARYRTIEQFMDQLQHFCGAMSLKPIRAPLGMFLDERRDTWVQGLSARGRVLEFVPPEEPAVGEFDPSRLGQCLDALADWRSRVGPPESAVRVRWWQQQEHFHLIWEEPGARLQEEPTSRGDGPTSLALPMVARVMAAHQGTLEIGHRGGVRLGLRWPIDLRLSSHEA